MRPHTAMLYYTQHAFCLTYFMAWGEGAPKTGNTFPTQKTRGKIIDPPVVKLRHAKVVLCRQHPGKKPVRSMHSCRYRIVWCLFSTRRLLREIKAVCFVVAVVPDSVAVAVCRSSASGRVGTYLMNKFVLLRT